MRIILTTIPFKSFRIMLLLFYVNIILYYLYSHRSDRDIEKDMVT